MQPSLTNLLEETVAGLELALLVNHYREAAALAQRMQTLCTLLARADEAAPGRVRP
jgi:hypothetical protein